jgi:hypothetical protein
VDRDVKKEAFRSALLPCLTRIIECEFKTYSVDEVQQHLASLEDSGPLVKLVESWYKIKADVMKLIGEEDRESLMRK